MNFEGNTNIQPQQGLWVSLPRALYVSTRFDLEAASGDFMKTENKDFIFLFWQHSGRRCKVGGGPEARQGTQAGVQA